MTLAALIAAGAVAWQPLEFTRNEAKLAYRTASGLVEKCTPRDSGTIRGRLAANYILDAASATGVDVDVDKFTAKTPRGEMQFTNLSVRFEGAPDAEWVVIVSHYDTKPGSDCPGANDGASTTGLLVALSDLLTDWKTPRGNVMLIWTDGEECFNAYGPDDGFWGSRHAAEKLKKEGLKVKAVICLDMLGDRDLNIYVPRNGSRALAKIAQYAAKEAGIADKVRLSDELVKDDHVAFLNQKMKATWSSFTSSSGLNDYWHTAKDTMENVSEDSLFASGKLVVGMLNVLLDGK